jgi:hypothetical protein
MSKRNKTKERCLVKVNKLVFVVVQRVEEFSFKDMKSTADTDQHILCDTELLRREDAEPLHEVERLRHIGFRCKNALEYILQCSAKATKTGKQTVISELDFEDFIGLSLHCRYALIFTSSSSSSQFISLFSGMGRSLRNCLLASSSASSIEVASASVMLSLTST